MAGKYRWCMIFLQVMIHKWELEIGCADPEPPLRAKAFRGRFMFSPFISA
jgi:hypothetical protein